MKSRIFDLVAVRPLRWPPSSMSLVWRTGAPHTLRVLEPSGRSGVDAGDWPAAESALREIPRGLRVHRNHLAVVDLRIKKPVSAYDFSNAPNGRSPSTRQRIALLLAVLVAAAACCRWSFSLCSGSNLRNVANVPEALQAIAEQPRPHRHYIGSSARAARRGDAVGNQPDARAGSLTWRSMLRAGKLRLVSRRPTGWILRRHSAGRSPPRCAGPRSLGYYMASCRLRWSLRSLRRPGSAFCTTLDLLELHGKCSHPRRGEGSRSRSTAPELSPRIRSHACGGAQPRSCRSRRWLPPSSTKAARSLSECEGLDVSPGASLPSVGHRRRAPLEEALRGRDGARAARIRRGGTLLLSMTSATSWSGACWPPRARERFPHCRQIARSHPRPGAPLTILRQIGSSRR